MNFNPINPFVQGIFQKYEALRPCFMSEGHFLNQFLWENYYNTKFATDDIALYLFFERNGKKGAFCPLCSVDHLPMAFERMKQQFHDVWNTKMNVYLIDSLTKDVWQSAGLLSGFTVKDDRDSADYIYEAEKLKTLSGRALHKKKNLVNAFMREYEGQYHYETLGCGNIEEVKDFHEKWLDERRIDDKYNCIDNEEEGVYRLLGNCKSVDCRMGGIRMNGELIAYTIGSYCESISCAFIHIEKAKSDIKGLYNYINQQFLIHEFPNARYVNREDDLGQENLRQAKLSYKPIRLEEKYYITENRMPRRTG